MEIRNDCRSVICQLKSTEKRDAILEVIDSCSIFKVLPDIDRFKRGVLRRERIESTGIGHGVAIAHGKIMGLHEVHVALGLSAKGIDFASTDGLPVHLLFVIASSPSIQMQYLKALSAILRSVHNEEIRKHLISLAHPEDDQACARFFSMLVHQDFLFWKAKESPSQP